MLMTTNTLLTDMKRYTLFTLLWAALAMGGCTKDLTPETNGTNNAVLDEGDGSRIEFVRQYICR